MLGADGTPATDGKATATLDNFGPKEQARRTIDLSKENPFRMEGTLAEPGFLRLTVEAKGVKQKGGVDFSAIREAIHPGKAGGPLSNGKTIKIAKPSRFSILVDWIEELRPYASRWQTGGDVGFQRKEVRRAIHARLGSRGLRELPVDPAATQPERPVTAPVAAEARREAPRVILGMVKSILRKKG